MKDGKATPDDGKIETIVNRFLQELGEMGCESARVFVTYRSEGASIHTAFSKGQGNSWAVKGQIAEWMAEERERIKMEVWADDEEEDPEDPDR